MITTWLWKPVEQSSFSLAGRQFLELYVGHYTGGCVSSNRQQEEARPQLPAQCLKPQDTMKTCVCPEDTFCQP